MSTTGIVFDSKYGVDFYEGGRVGVAVHGVGVSRPIPSDNGTSGGLGRRPGRVVEGADVVPPWVCGDEQGDDAQPEAHEDLRGGGRGG